MSPDENEVVGAAISDDGTLNLRFASPRSKQTSEYGNVRLPDGNMRTIYNRNEKNEYSIKDGKMTANGEQSLAMQRCK